MNAIFCLFMDLPRVGVFASDLTLAPQIRPEMPPVMSFGGTRNDTTTHFRRKHSQSGYVTKEFRATPARNSRQPRDDSGRVRGGRWHIRGLPEPDRARQERALLRYA